MYMHYELNHNLLINLIFLKLFYILFNLNGSFHFICFKTVKPVSTYTYTYKLIDFKDMSTI